MPSILACAALQNHRGFPGCETHRRLMKLGPELPGVEGLGLRSALGTTLDSVLRFTGRDESGGARHSG